MRLLHEGVHVELPGERLAAPAAGHLHVQPLRHHDVLSAQQPGAVGGELGLPGPLEEREPHRQHREAGEHGQRAEADEREDRRDGAVERMAAQHVAQLVGEEHAQLVVVEQLDRRRVDHDERLVDAVRAGVEERRLGDVELGHVGPVEGGGDLGVQVPEPGELARPDPDGVALEQEPDAALAAEQREHLADHLVHPGHRPKRLERRPVGGVLPGDRGDLREGAAGAGGGNGRAHRSLGVGDAALTGYGNMFHCWDARSNRARCHPERSEGA